MNYYGNGSYPGGQQNDPTQNNGTQPGAAPQYNAQQGGYDFQSAQQPNSPGFYGGQPGGQGIPPAQPANTGYFGAFSGRGADFGDQEAQRKAAAQQTYYGASGDSPYEYRQQKAEAQKKEKKGMFKNVSLLAVLLIIYNILNYAYLRLYYYVVYYKVKGEFASGWREAAEYLRDNEPDLIQSTAFLMTANLMITLCSAISVFIIAQFIMRIKISEMFRPFKGAVKTGFLWAPPALTINLLMSIVVSIIINMLNESGVVVPEADFSINHPSTIAMIMQFTYVCLLGPIIEELIYRGLIIKLLSPYGKGLAVFVSALFFGMMHGNISQAVTAFAGGLIYAMVAVRYDSILPTIIIHIVNNTVSSITDFGDALGKNTDTLYYGTLITVMLLGFYVLIVKLKGLSTEVKEITPQYALALRSRAVRVFLNVFMIIYMYAFILYEFVASFKDANA